MATVIELQQQVIEGEEARQLLQSGTMRKLDDYVREWAMTKLIEHCQDPEALQQVAYRVRAHNDHLSWIQEIADTGKIASMELDNGRD